MSIGGTTGKASSKEASPDGSDEEISVLRWRSASIAELATLNFFFQMCSLLKYLIRFCHRIKMINLKFSRNEWEKLVKLCEVDPKLIDEEPPWTDDLELKIARKKLRKFVTFKLDD